MSETLEKPTEIFSLEKLEATNLPELQGLREKQQQIVDENPFVGIVDNKTYELAKSHRTNLVTARTTIQNQEKVVVKKINAFRDAVKGYHAEVVAISLPHEEKQQDEVKRFEAKKEAEKAEKLRIEEERKTGIKNSIEAIYQRELSKLESLTFEAIETLKVDWEQNLLKTETEQFEEFELDFNEKVLMLKNQFSAKEIRLKEAENQRLENLRIEEEKKKLAEERAELDRKKKENEEKAAAERKVEEDRLAKIKADQEAELEAQRQKLADDKAKQDAELKAQQDKIDAENKKIQDEKDRLAKIEADKLAKEESERKAKEDAERAEKERIEADERAKAEAARMEELKPDLEKAIDYFKSVKFSNEYPTFNDREFNKVFEHELGMIDFHIEEAIKTIQNFK